MPDAPCRCVQVEGYGIDSTGCRADEHRGFTGRDTTHRWVMSDGYWWTCTRCHLSSVNRDEAPPCEALDA